jgi:hypothetical protein
VSVGACPFELPFFFFSFFGLSTVFFFFLWITFPFFDFPTTTGGRGRGFTALRSAR